MNNNLLGRFISALAMGGMLGGYVHHDYVKWGQRGREAFLVHQTKRFDQYMVIPHPTIATVFTATIVMFGALAIYEGLAFVVSLVLKSMSGTSGKV